MAEPPEPAEPAGTTTPVAQAVRVTVVGVCGSGKSELVRRLQARGVAARAVGQEHTLVADLWQRHQPPDVLVYLAASRRAVLRRGRVGLTAAELAEQRRRLSLARRHAHLRLQTDRRSAAEVEALVLAFLQRLPDGSAALHQNQGEPRHAG